MGVWPQAWRRGQWAENGQAVRSGEAAGDEPLSRSLVPPQCDMVPNGSQILAVRFQNVARGTLGNCDFPDENGTDAVGVEALEGLLPPSPRWGEMLCL